MFQIKLHDLLIKIFTSTVPLDFEWFHTYMLERLNFFGEENAHLHYQWLETRKRPTPLSPEEMIRGDYLLYNCSNHDECEMITSCKDLKEVEYEILHPAGWMNLFTSHMLVFERGQLKRFNIIGIDENQMKHVFEKHQNEKLFVGHYEGETKVPSRLHDIHIEWIDH